MRRAAWGGGAVLAALAGGGALWFLPGDPTPVSPIVPYVTDEATAALLEPGGGADRARVGGLVLLFRSAGGGEPDPAADRALALQRWVAASEPLDASPIDASVGLLSVCTADGRDVDRLLWVERWGELEPLVAGQLVAIAPSRDLVLFTGSENPDGVEAMWRMAEVVFATDPRPLTPTALVWSPGGWSSWDGSP